MQTFGIDIGGSGVKGAPVDAQTGTLAGERHRIETPQPATPQAVADTVAQLVRHFDWRGPIGVGFPAALRRGTVLTAANIDKSWIGQNADDLFTQATGSPVHVANDADVAGLAEMAFGAGKDNKGVVLVVTLGTGIGTALFVNGTLLPNTELGHIELNGRDAEEYAADSAREREDLKWGEWAKRVDKYLLKMEALFWPDLIIVGGGVSKKSEKFLPHLTVKTPIVPAALRNEAGIVGAAALASSSNEPALNAAV